jgi:hypothetical protein
MRQFLIRAAAVTAPIFFLLVIFEVVLRLCPSLIGLALLDRFEPRLAAEIAGRIGLRTSNDYRVFTTEERTDQGNDFYFYKPNTEYFVPADEADKTAGIVETIKTDFVGFCDPRGAAQRQPDILLISGSVPGCNGILPENSVMAQLATITGLTTYNMSVAGVGPYEYLEILRRFGLPMRPRAVIMAISEANDIRDCLRHLDFRAGKRQQRRTSDNSLFAFSYALSVIKSGLELSIRTFNRVMGANFRYSAVVQNRRVALNVANGDLGELRDAKRVREGEVGPELYEPPLRAFVEIAKSRDFVPVVIDAPAAYSVYANSITFDDDQNGEVMRGYGDAQRQWLAANARRLGYIYVEVLPYMQKAAETRPLLYFPANVHLTAEGHKVLAEAMAPQMRALLAAD